MIYKCNYFTIQGKYLHIFLLVQQVLTIKLYLIFRPKFYIIYNFTDTYLSSFFLS